MFTELGGIDFASFDDWMVGGSLTLAAKYVVLGMETFNDYHELGRADALAAISDELTQVLVRYREDWKRRQEP